MSAASDLHAKELKSLVRSDLDADASGLILHASWTKNRKSGFRPLPRDLIVKLQTWAENETAAKCCQMYTRKSDPKPPQDPLLYVPSHPARELDEDLDAADIPKWAADGKVDFHACPVAYITLLFEGGADVKTVQTLARHCEPQRSMQASPDSD